MFNFLQSLIKNDIFVVFCIILFIAFFIVFTLNLLNQAKYFKKAREIMKKEVSETQKELFKNASEMLAKNLIEYTDKVLVERIENSYKKIMSNELLPAVNDAAKQIADLSVAVTERQEIGLAKLAEGMAVHFTSKIKDYIDQQAKVIDSMNQSSVAFSKEINKINGVSSLLVDKFQIIYDQAYSISSNSTNAINELTEKIDKLTTSLETTMSVLTTAGETIAQTSISAKELSNATTQMQKVANETTLSLNNQNEKIAKMLSDSINTMRENTEKATKSVVSDFNERLSTTTETISNSVVALKDIVKGINDSATAFVSSISTTNENSTNIISQTISSETEKLRLSAETYSTRFVNSLSTLNSTIESHLNNLQLVTNQLSNAVSSFKSDVDMSSSRFEIGIEKTVSDVLTQMDNSLSEIVKRIVLVTQNIQEAADALPKAVKAIK